MPAPAGASTGNEWAHKIDVPIDPRRGVGIQYAHRFFTILSLCLRVLAWDRSFSKGGAAMKAGHWMAMVVVFVLGLIAGFAAGRAPAKIVSLENRIQELTAENTALKSRLATLPAPASQAPATTPIAAPAGK
jgi:hypothetical protein